MNALATALIEGGGEVFVSNREFLNAIFGPAHHDAHVTAFKDDPSAIPQDRLPICWAGDKFASYDYILPAGTNQYFCISIFGKVDGRAVRRKSEFLFCCVIVADDVKDKVPEYKAKLLPPPSWRLETSPGNEQWGWILYFHITDRARVDNLLDGVVEMGLAPDGVDPGMKGVTRYVRLPEGWNTKAKYGEPFKCRMLEWEPERRVTLEELAAPFGVDLEKRRSDDKEYGRSDGGYPDHPVFDYVDILGDAPDGGYNIVCPWEEEHGDRANSGTWLTINDDSTLGFHCHHGHCQGRGVQAFLDKTGSRDRIDTWRVFREIKIDETQSDTGTSQAGGWGLAGVSISTEAPERVVSMHEGAAGDGMAGTGVQGGAGAGEVAASQAVHKQTTRGIEDEQMAMESQVGGVGTGSRGAEDPVVQAEAYGIGNETDRTDGSQQDSSEVGGAGQARDQDQTLAGAEAYIRTNNAGPAQSGGFLGEEAGYSPIAGDNGYGGALVDADAGGETTRRACAPLEGGGREELEGRDQNDSGQTEPGGSGSGGLWSAGLGGEEPVPPVVGQVLPNGGVVTNDQPWHALIATLPPDPASDLAALRRVIAVLVKLNGLERGAAVKALKDAVRSHLKAADIDAEVKVAKKALTRERNDKAARDSSGFNDVANGWVFVADVGRFLNKNNNSMLTDRNFKNRYMYLERDLKDAADELGEGVPSDILKALLMSDMLTKADTLDYRPGHQRLYHDSDTNKLTFNLWDLVLDPGIPGDVSTWLNHFRAMLLSPEEIEHILDWMAYTLQHPETKINHIIVVGGREGIGKDYLFYPMVQALKTHSKTVDGADLNTDFNEHLLGTKHLHINELEAGNKKDLTAMSAKLKPLAAAPPGKIQVNPKGTTKVYVRNIVNCTATTNECYQPISISKGSRRYYMVWSDVIMRDDDDQVLPQWDAYWEVCWPWMKEEGQGNWRACVNYLMNRDVSLFNAGAPPRVTDHQKSVVQASQPPMDQYLDAMLESRQGVFGYDMLTADRVFKQMQLEQEDIVSRFGFYRLPDVARIGRDLSSRLGKPTKINVRDEQKVRSLYVYIVANYETYRNMALSDIARYAMSYPLPGVHN